MIIDRTPRKRASASIIQRTRLECSCPFLVKLNAPAVEFDLVQPLLTLCGGAERKSKQLGAGNAQACENAKLASSVAEAPGQRRLEIKHKRP
jgi:hypothetical protein